MSQNRTDTTLRSECLIEITVSVGSASNVRLSPTSPGERSEVRGTACARWSVAEVGRSEGSWFRIDRSKAANSGEGETANSSDNRSDSERYVLSACVWRPPRYNASISWPASLSRNG